MSGRQDDRAGAVHGPCTVAAQARARPDAAPARMTVRTLANHRTQTS